MKYFELVFVQNNPLYNDDNDDQQSVKENLNKPTSKATSNEHESQVEDAKEHSDTTSISKIKCEARYPVKNSLSKPIIRTWEEISHNKHIIGLGYEKEVTFHIPDYSKPIQFQSVGFLQEVSTSPKVLTSPVQVQHHNAQFQHCNRVGHMESQCFDLHPCQHCGKSNHASTKCSKRKKPTILKIHYEWIDPWKWSSTAKQLFKSYRRIQSRVKTNIASHKLSCTWNKGL